MIGITATVLERHLAAGAQERVSLVDLLSDALALIHDLRRRVEVLERQVEALDEEAAAGPRQTVKREGGRP